MDEKHRKVFAWLERLFIDEPMPAFEMNSKTIDILGSLVDINSRKDQDMKILLEDIVEKKEEYKSEAKRIQQILSRIGVPLNNLSQSGMTSVKILTDAAVVLELKDIQHSSYVLAINELLKDIHKVKIDKMKSLHYFKKQLRKTNNTLIEYNKLQRACQALEEQISLQQPLLRQRLRETGFLNQKSVEYQQQLDKLQEYQKQAKLEPEFFHKALEKLYEDIVILEEEMKPLKSKFDNYHSLPPDISLAKVKLEEARRELESLENQLTRNIESMHSM